MFRVYIFAQMLKVARGIDTTEFSKEINDAVSFMKIQPYISMIRNYLNHTWQVPYSIPHMIKEAMAGNFQFESQLQEPLSIQFGDITICHIPLVQRIPMPNVGGQTFKDKYERSIFYDDKFYDAAYDWWVHYKDILVYEMLFKVGDTGFHITIYYGERENTSSKFSGAEDWLYASGVFQWWLFFESGKGLAQTYRIHPGPAAGSKIESCLGSKMDKLVEDRLQHFGYPEPLSDGYIRYVCKKESFEQYDATKLKKIIYEGE